ncbi:MAG TPA: hypothetical protein VF806_02345 [Anaerolineaceae bacterium]
MRIVEFIKRALVYLGNILLIDLGVGLLMAVSFIFTGNFTFTALSERIFYAGLGITFLAAIVGLAANFSGRGFGIPVIIRRPHEARALLDHFGEYREEVEKRYEVAIHVFVTGLGCLVVSALVQILFAR